MGFGWAEAIGGVGEGPGAVFGELHGVVLRFRVRVLYLFFLLAAFLKDFL